LTSTTVICGVYYHAVLSWTVYAGYGSIGIGFFVGVVWTGGNTGISVDERSG
jgi:hypothetical protein